MNKIIKGNLKINSALFEFINNEVIPGTDINPENFWLKFDESVHFFAPINKKLLIKREQIQKKVDEWHKSKKGETLKKDEYINFLKSIDYIVEEKKDFQITTSNVDEEISKIAGPQLVVPVDNARYALNAANARWGSLYDALYGTDIIQGNKNKEYDPDRGRKVIEYVRNFLDQISPLDDETWSKINEIKIEGKNLTIIINGKNYYLKNKNQFVGFSGEKENLKSILIKNNNLHVEVMLNPNHIIGKNDKAHISDVVMESAISTIVDNEDSVAAVDAEDKIKCYRNWLGIMKGTLQTEMEKNGKKLIRKLNPDKNFTGINGESIILHGRALLLNRNVGHLMTNPSIILKDGSEIPEGIMDAFFSTLCSLHDFKNQINSRTKSVYIVKPKMHGPEEVEFTNNLFGKV